MKIQRRIKDELRALDKMIKEKNDDILKMINLSAEAEMLLRKKNISEYEAEVMEKKLLKITGGLQGKDHLGKEDLKKGSAK